MNNMEKLNTHKITFRADSRVRVRSQERMEMLMECIRRNSDQCDEYDETRKDVENQ